MLMVGQQKASGLYKPASIIHKDSFSTDSAQPGGTMDTKASSANTDSTAGLTVILKLSG